MNQTEKSLAHSLLEKPLKSADDNLESFFQPLESSLLTIRDQDLLGIFDSTSPKLMNSFYGPLIKNYPQISSMGLANSEGFEFDVLPAGNGFDNRVVWVDKWGMTEHWSHWDVDPKTGTATLTREWKDSLLTDPRERPWFKGALAASGRQISWTDPYLYNTTFEVGMTASLSWKDPHNPARPNDKDVTNILAFDITLTDISNFTQQMKVSPDGKFFILTKDGNFIGLPKDPLFENDAQRKEGMLSSVDSVNIPAIRIGFETWLQSNNPQASFEFDCGENSYWGRFSEFSLSNSNKLIVGAIVPEQDILSEVARTKRVVIGSFLFVLVLTGFVLYSYGQSKKANRLLNVKNEEIETKNMLIEEKNREILDSINYAKRIQGAILPPDAEFQKWLPNAFVLYKPKDIVAGDFYWLEEKDGTVLLAAADCTGHGVPGAMVSVICKNGLSRSVREYKQVEPGKILDTTRSIVITEFKKSTDEVKDGMDIALVAMVPDENGCRLQYAGAHNPLWIVRKGSNKIEEIKATKQPIGKFENAKPFTTHELRLNPGDTFYLPSDGYQDQFGGIKGKKYKSGPLKTFLLSIQEKSMEEQKKLLDQEFESWRGDIEQIDDVCIIGVRV